MARRVTARMSAAAGHRRTARAAPGRAPALPPVSETQLSHSIRGALERLGYWVIRIQAGQLRMGEEKARYIHGAEPGTPDLLVVAPVYGWLEVKRDGARLSLTQKAWHARARMNGLQLAVVHSVHEALATVSGWDK